MRKSQFPKGWNEARVQAVLNYHESLTDDEEAAEIGAMLARRDEAIMAIPRKLVPEVEKLLAAHAGSARSRSRKSRRVA